MIDTLEASYNIDPTQIYANGFSNGGDMAFVLSCTLSDRIAAVGMVAAAHEVPWSWCADHRPVPMVAFHGTADPLVPYQEGPSFDPVNLVKFPAVRDWASNWARTNRCVPNPIESAVTANVIRVQYTKCADDAGGGYTVMGGGHQWPGGKPIPEWLVGPYSRNIDATSLMWAFFREHRLRRK